MPALLADAPLLPWSCRVHWRWWMELHQGRGQGGLGPAGLTWSDLQAWSRFTGNELSGEDVAMIFAIDHAWLRVVNEKTGGARDG